MIVAENDVRDVREVDPHVLGVVKHCIGTGASIEQNAAAVDFHQRGEAPFTNALVCRQHSGKHADLERLRAMVGWGLSGDQRCD